MVKTQITFFFNYESSKVVSSYFLFAYCNNYRLRLPKGNLRRIY